MQKSFAESRKTCIPIRKALPFRHWISRALLLFVEKAAAPTAVFLYSGSKDRGCSSLNDGFIDVVLMRFAATIRLRTPWTVSYCLTIHKMIHQNYTADTAWYTMLLTRQKRRIHGFVAVDGGNMRQSIQCLMGNRLYTVKHAALNISIQDYTLNWPEWGTCTCIIGQGRGNDTGSDTIKACIIIRCYTPLQIFDETPWKRVCNMGRGLLSGLCACSTIQLRTVSF